MQSLRLFFQIFRLSIQVRAEFGELIFVLLDVAAILEDPYFHGPDLVLRGFLQTSDVAFPLPERLVGGLGLGVESAEFRLTSGRFVVSLLEELRL